MGNMRSKEEGWCRAAVGDCLPRDSEHAEEGKTMSIIIKTPRSPLSPVQQPLQLVHECDMTGLIADVSDDAADSHINSNSTHKRRHAGGVEGAGTVSGEDSERCWDFQWRPQHLLQKHPALSTAEEEAEASRLVLLASQQQQQQQVAPVQSPPAALKLQQSPQQYARSPDVQNRGGASTLQSPALSDLSRADTLSPEVRWLVRSDQHGSASSPLFASSFGSTFGKHALHQADQHATSTGALATSVGVWHAGNVLTDLETTGPKHYKHARPPLPPANLPGRLMTRVFDQALCHLALLHRVARPIGHCPHTCVLIRASICLSPLPGLECLPCLYDDIYI